LIADLTASPILSILVGLNILFALFSAWEAYRTARSQKFDYLEAPEKRPRFVQTFCTSYLGHILTLVLFILVPIMASGGASGKGGQKTASRPGDGGGGSLTFDVVTAPGKVDGFGKKPEGTATGKGKEKPKKNSMRIARQKGKGTQKSKPAAQAKGNARSYNEYLSYRFHSSDLSEKYFSQLPLGEYTVLQYTVDADGTIDNIEILRDHSTTSDEISQIAVETVRSFNPAAPLPTGVHSLRVVELFWSGSVVGDSGSLENELSQQIDGRKVYVEP
jgi:protease PrsW